MMHEWLPQSPADLRGQASKLQALAAHVCRREVAQRLQERAAELIAEAELKAVAART
jgi:hypothetical protein